MAKKKSTATTGPPGERSVETASPTPTSPHSDIGELPPSDTNGTAEALPPEPPGNGNGERRPVHVLSYLIGQETYAQCSIWERHAQRRDGTPFTTWDISIRKRYRDARDGQWKSLYSFAASELYAVQHALEQAAHWVAEARAGDCPF